MYCIKYASILCSLFFLSCQDWSTARFIVKNKSDIHIDSLFFLPAGNVKQQIEYLKLSPGEEKRYYLSMEGLSGDGAYSIQYKLGNKFVHKTFGYYTNGASVEKYTVIEIESDTMMMRSVF